MNSDNLNEILDKHLLFKESPFDWSIHEFKQIQVIDYFKTAIFQANDNSNNLYTIKLLTLFISYLNTQSKKSVSSELNDTWNNIIKPNLLPREEDDYMAKKALQSKIKEVDMALSYITNSEELTQTKTERLSIYASLTSIHESFISSDYFDEKEVDGENLIYQNIKGEKIIQFLSLHLFIKKICLGNFYTQYPILITGFIQQCPAFLNLEMFIQKIQKAFFLYHEHKKLLHNNIILFLNDLILTRYDEISTPNNLTILYNFYNKLIGIYKNNDKVFTVNQLEPILSIVKEKTDNYHTTFIKYTQKKKTRTQTVSIKKVQSLKAVPTHYFDYQCWKSDDIALHLTYFSRDIMVEINPNEIICARYAKKNKHITSPNILKLIDRFDKLIFFIVEEILSYDYPADRANVITYWVEVGKKCKEMNNFNDLITISTAFKNPQLICLRKTWKKVSSATLKDIETLNQFCTSDSSYIHIREGINECIQNNVCYLPYLGLLLKEISYYEEVVPSLKDDCLISFNKINKVAVCIETFFSFEKLPFNFRPTTELDILNNINPKTYESLGEISDQLEPEFRYRKKRLREKRLTDTDRLFYKDEVIIPCKIINSSDIKK